ncbi:MAG: DUF192 domain-containing protein [Steroidobacteraceae bacterium]|nr:DUF192 domain-containing protein [Steroidobacteraceae bacterium]
MRTTRALLDSRELPLEVLVCESFFERARGLLLRPPLARHQALLIEPCSAVHMLGMRYAIDVVFVDRDARVVCVLESLRPWRFGAARGAHATWELASGVSKELRIERGTTLRDVRTL